MTDFRLVQGEEPPHTPPGGALYRNLVELTKTPDEWGRVMSGTQKVRVRQTCYDLRSGKNRKRPPGVWEFTYGETEDGRWGVWAKYTAAE